MLRIDPSWHGRAVWAGVVPVSRKRSGSSGTVAEPTARAPPGCIHALDGLKLRMSAYLRCTPERRPLRARPFKAGTGVTPSRSDRARPAESEDLYESDARRRVRGTGDIAAPQPGIAGPGARVKCGSPSMRRGSTLSIST